MILNSMMKSGTKFLNIRYKVISKNVLNMANGPDPDENVYPIKGWLLKVSELYVSCRQKVCLMFHCPATQVTVRLLGSFSFSVHSIDKVVPSSTV